MRAWRHFAGSGPPNRFCGQCAYWDGKPTVKAAPCLEHKRLMSGRAGPKVPAGAGACKYFALASLWNAS
jgi:hypothetical protein